MQNLVDSHDTNRLASMIVNGEGTQHPNGEISSNENNDARASTTYRIRKPDDRERDIQRVCASSIIYYGDEAGMWGGHDPDDRMPMVWEDLNTIRWRLIRAAMSVSPMTLTLIRKSLPITRKR